MSGNEGWRRNLPARGFWAIATFLPFIRYNIKSLECNGLDDGICGNL